MGRSLLRPAKSRSPIASAPTATAPASSASGTSATTTPAVRRTAASTRPSSTAAAASGRPPTTAATTTSTTPICTTASPEKSPATAPTSGSTTRCASSQKPTPRRKPFFCYLATNAPHVAHVVARGVRRVLPGPQRPARARLLRHDRQHRRERRARWPPCSGTTASRENTIVIFMTDNGSAAGASGVQRRNARQQGLPLRRRPPRAVLHLLAGRRPQGRPRRRPNSPRTSTSCLPSSISAASRNPPAPNSMADPSSPFSHPPNLDGRSAPSWSTRSAWRISSSGVRPRS